MATGGAQVSGVVAARDLVDRLGPITLNRQLSGGDFVHLEGDDAETVSIVLSGQLMIEAYPVASWEPCAIGVAGPGCLIGEEALAGEEAKRRTSIRSLTASTLATIYRRDLVDSMATDARARHLVLRLLADRSHTSNQAVLASGASSVDVRVGRWLLHMADTFNSGPGHSDIAATQEHIASLAGTRRPTANKVLNDLQHAGIVTLRRGRVRVETSPGLERWLESIAGT